MPEVDALALRGRLEVQLDSEANAQAQRIVDDLVRQQARDGDDRDEPELELIVSPIHGDSRRLRIQTAVEPGVAWALEEAEWTGCAWRPVGREQLDRVDIDGDVWHEADATSGQATTRGP